MLIALKQEQPLSVQKELLEGGKEHLSKGHGSNCSHQLKETDSRDAIEGSQTDTQTNAGDRLLEQAQIVAHGLCCGDHHQGPPMVTKCFVLKVLKMSAQVLKLRDIIYACVHVTQGLQVTAMPLLRNIDKLCACRSDTTTMNI